MAFGGSVRLFKLLFVCLLAIAARSGLGWQLRGRPSGNIGNTIELHEALKGLLPPPPEGAPLHLDHPEERFFSLNGDKLPPGGVERVVLTLLRNKTNGFFVESGAFDGERNSNTLMFERERDWRGLLVEPSPVNIEKILKKNRRAHVFQGCVSNTGEAKTANFDVEEALAKRGLPDYKLLEGDQAGDADNEYGHLSTAGGKGDLTVTCAPLHEMLKSIGQRTVDFWSLDVEGSEGEVLAATDFTQFEVGVLLIEHNRGKGIRDACEANGFKKIDLGSVDRLWREYTFSNGSGVGLDELWVNPAYFRRRGLAVPSEVPAHPEY